MVEDQNDAATDIRHFYFRTRYSTFQRDHWPSSSQRRAEKSSLFAHIESPGWQGFTLMAIDMMVYTKSHAKLTATTTSLPRQSWETLILSQDLLRRLFTEMDGEMHDHHSPVRLQMA